MRPVVTAIPCASQPAMPWANGGGSTRQVAIDPPGATLAGAFRWRVSIAQIASDGPFSRLPGIDRAMWLVRGDGVRLDVDGREVVLAQSRQRIDFPGEAAVRCELLGGPCEDSNVMTAREQVTAVADVVELAAGVVHALPDAPQRVVLLWSGQGRIDGVALGPRDAVRIDGRGEVAFVADAPTVALVAAFTPRH
jgi:environmental stress-induced protein Ves